MMNLRLGAIVFLCAVGCTPKLPATNTNTADADATNLDAASVDQFVAQEVVARDLVTQDRTASADGACATESAGAEPVPLDLYVMMDSSRSMLESTTAGATKWSAVTSALTAFFNDPQSAGIGVGLRYFPDVQPNVPATCTADTACAAFGPCDLRKSCVRTGKTSTAVTLCGDTTLPQCASDESCSLLGTCPIAGGYCVPAGSTACDGGEMCKPIDGYCHARDICESAPYAVPTVAVGQLPGAAAALSSSLTTHKPDGFTPTGPALSGALQFAKARAMANAGHKVAVLFVTDGLPSECTPLDLAGIGAIANTAATGTPAVPTFVIGVFSTTEATTATPNLNALATKGGTGSAVVISTNQDVTQVLQGALNQIRTKEIACEYKVPPSSGGGAIDFGKVNVQYTSGAGKVATIGHVASATACDATRGGWYYDVDPATGARPTSIKACGATCSQVQGDSSGRVDIVLGCVTVSIE